MEFSNVYDTSAREIERGRDRESLRHTSKFKNTHTHTRSAHRRCRAFIHSRLCCWWRWSWAMTMPFIYSQPPVWKRQIHAHTVARTLHRPAIFSISLFAANFTSTCMHVTAHRHKLIQWHKRNRISIWLASNVKERESKRGRKTVIVGAREQDWESEREKEKKRHLHHFS